MYNATTAAKLLGVTTQCISSLVKRNRMKAEHKGKSLEIKSENIVEYANLRLEELYKESKELEGVLDYLK